MNLFAQLAVLVCVALETGEHILFRLASTAGRRKLVLIVAAIALNLAFTIVWLGVLRGAALSVAMPLLSAANITVALAGARLFGERITRRRWVGIGLITAGIALIAGSTA